MSSSLPRALALFGLFGLVLLGLPGERGRVTDGLASPEPRRVAASAAAAPDWSELLRHAAEAPLHAVVSGRTPAVRLDPPRGLEAGRVAALRVTAARDARVTLERPEGARDTLLLDGGSRAAFLLRPVSSGWRTWRLEVEETGAATLETAWSAHVRPTRPVRVLGIGGPPDNEPRTVLRALEEAGEEARSWVHLGRDVWVGRAGGPLPSDAAAYEDVDVVMLFPGVDLGPAQAEALLGAVRDAGKGLLLAGSAGGSAELTRAVLGGASWADGPIVHGDSVGWSLPPEIRPLPGADVHSARRLVEGHGADATPLHLAPAGRGRLAALDLTETWRWRMQAGATGGHRAFWQDLAAWLAGGFAEDPLLEVLGADHRAGDVVQVRRVDRTDAEPAAPALRVERDDTDGSARWTLALDPSDAPAADGMRIAHGGFVPFTAGGHTLLPAEVEVPVDSAGRIIGAPVARPDVPVRETEAPGTDPEGRLARVAAASPGGSVVLAGVPSAAVPGDSMLGPGLSRLLLFALLGALFLASWLLRRLEARP